jgi:hypothetical protein
MSNNLEAWKSFLKGRVAIEKGDFRGGLAAIDEAVRINPSDPTFLKSKAIAEELAKNSPESVTVLEIEAAYSQLAHNLIGQKDKPDSWVTELQGLLAKAETVQEARGVNRAQLVAW